MERDWVQLAPAGGADPEIEGDLPDLVVAEVVGAPCARRHRARAAAIAVQLVLDGLASADLIAPVKH